MIVFQAVLILAALLCSVVAGFLFAFAVVVMPGIRSLDDGGFIRAFQVIDRVIQNNQPLFIFVWVGSVLSLITTTVMGVWELGGLDRQLLVIATLIYVLGVQLPTVIVNVPLNNMLQTPDSASMNELTESVRGRALRHAGIDGTHSGRSVRASYPSCCWFSSLEREKTVWLIPCTLSLEKTCIQNFSSTQELFQHKHVSGSEMNIRMKPKNLNLQDPTLIPPWKRHNHQA